MRLSALNNPAVRQPGRLTARDWLTLFAGLGVFAAVTLPTLAASSIWFDEAFGAYLIRFGYGDIARYTASDVHPPLYYWVLKAWSTLTTGLGNEFTLRLLSVVFGMVALTFVWLFVRRWFGRRIAGVTLAVALLTPFFVRYSQEMRMYTMVAAIAFAATYVLTLAEQSKKTWQWAVYGLLIGLGMLTHYYAALIWLTHWVWRASVLRSDGLRGRALLRAFFSRGWILAHGLGLLLFAPWIGVLAGQIRDVQSNGFWIPAVTPATPVNFLTQTTVYLQQMNLTGWGTLVFGLFMAGAVGLLIGALRRLASDSRRRYYALIVMLAAVPPLLLLLASLPPLRPSFVDRYVTASALAVGTLIGLSLGIIREKTARWRWRLMLVAVIGLLAYGVANVYRLGNYSTDTNTSNGARQVVARIRQRTPQAPIIADSPWLYYEAAFYSTRVSPVLFIDARIEYKYGSLLMLKENDTGKIKDLAGFEAAHPTFWYIGRPAAYEETPPSSNLTVIDSFRIDDAVTGKPDYQAVRYRVL